MDWTENSTENYLSRIRFDFITQLEKKMESIPLTQADLAKELNVTEGYVSQILNNPSNLTLKTIVRYARAIGLKVSIVAYDDNDPQNNKGLINSEIFSICWEKQGKPSDFFALQEDATKTPSAKGRVLVSDTFSKTQISNIEINADNEYLLTETTQYPKLTTSEAHAEKVSLGKQSNTAEIKLAA